MTKYQAETTLSLLVAMTLFTLILFVFSHWQSEQNYRLNKHYQQQQAAKLLENQIALELADLDCESHIIQNGISYQIECLAHKKSIRFPLGKIDLNND